MKKALDPCSTNTRPGFVDRPIVRVQTAIGCAAAIAMLSCDMEADPVAPGATHDSPMVQAIQAADSLALQPLGVVLFTPTGETPEQIDYAALLLDSAGTALQFPSAGAQWQLDTRGGPFRIVSTAVERAGRRAIASLEAVDSGHDTLRATATGAQAHATIENWEWLTPEASWTGSAWTGVGAEPCGVVRFAGLPSDELDLALFRVFAASLDEEVLGVRSIERTDRSALELCLSGKSSGVGRVAVAAWDEVEHRYMGFYLEHIVLRPPVTAVLPEGARIELGVGQAEQLTLYLRDSEGQEVAVSPDDPHVEWSSDDGSVARVERGGAISGIRSGTTSLSAEYEGASPGAPIAVDVFEMVGGRVGGEVVCVLLRRGSVRCWGNTDVPMLGYGISGTMPRGTIIRPWQVADIDLGAPAALLSGASYSNACAIDPNRLLRCWGKNSWGSVGYPGRINVGFDDVPADAGPVDIGGPVASVAQGSHYHYCVVLADGGLRCIGSNLAGNLGYGVDYLKNPVVGDDETPASMGDVPLGVDAPVVQAAIGGRAGMTCAVFATGQGKCWGLNAVDWVPETRQTVTPSYGLGYGAEYGVDSPIGDDETPADVPVLPLEGIARIAVGGYHICAQMDRGTVRCWGDNTFGQVGNGQGDDPISLASESVELDFGSPVVDLVATFWSSCALLANGSVQCWGGGARGSLGRGRPDHIGNWERADAVPGASLGGPAARILAGGLDSYCAIMRAGGLRCWGPNWNGYYGYFQSGIVGDNETPESLGDIRVFAGVVTGPRHGVRSTPVLAAARAEAAGAEPTSMMFVGQDFASGHRIVPLAGPHGLVTIDPSDAQTQLKWRTAASRNR